MEIKESLPDKMRIKNQIILLSAICVLFMTSCQRHRSDSYVPYQSFDEFTMQEIQNYDLKEPFVWVQHGNDTIKIVRTDNLHDTMVYLNKGEYWYSSVNIKYEYTWWSKLLNKIYPSPTVFGYDIQQADVYRYHMKDTTIEVFFYDMLPGNICVHNRKLSKIYDISDNSSDSILFDLAGGNNLYAHYIQNDSVCIANKVYRYDAVKNEILEHFINAIGYTIPCDFIKLNALELYHVPTYLFSIENGSSVTSIATNRKMHVYISCTTKETNKY